MKDTYSKSYERQVFGVLGVTGNIGGVFEVLQIAGGILVSFFSGNIFLYSLLNKLYQVEEKSQENESKSCKILWKF